MIKFGTSGWRGIIARDFTFDNVRLATQGIADYLKQLSTLNSSAFAYGFGETSPKRSGGGQPSTCPEPLNPQLSTLNWSAQVVKNSHWWFP